MGGFSRILLTGGTGFAGGYLAGELADVYPAAERVLLRRAALGGQAHSAWRALEADITEQTEVDAAIEQFRPNLIVHMAAQSSVDVATADSTLTWRVNHGGAVAIAEAVRRHVPAATVFFTSSAEVYGDSFRNGPAGETARLQPRGDYGKAKVAAERSLREILPDTARLIIARAFNHTGPRQTTSFVLPLLASQVADIEAGRGPPVVRMGNLAPRRDFLHVRDVVAAYLDLLRLAPSLPLGGQAGPANTFNVASGVSHQIGDIVAMFQERARAPIRVEVDPARVRANEVMEVSGLIEKITNATGWRPKIPIEDIIDELLDYWRSQAN